MKLIDLSPLWVEKSELEHNTAVDRYIEFRCPACPDLERCRLIIPVGRNEAGSWGWNREEDFSKLTIEPSIWHHCKTDPHFFIRSGEIVFA